MNWLRNLLRRTRVMNSHDRFAKRTPVRARPQLELLEDRTLMASSFLSLPEFAGATAQPLVVPGTSGLAGHLYVVQDPVTGDVNVAYEQDRSVNDNSYGVNAYNWPNGHTFRDLVGSDKAEFRFRDAAGNVVLDFYLDYVSTTTASSSAPSGYKSLGALGGDGDMVSGNSAWILSWDTGMARNLNYYKSAYGSLTVGGVDLLVNSPPADASGNALDQGTFGAWDFHDWFRVRISAAAFGAAGFGSAAITDQHNSPSKLGINSFVPEPPPPPPPPPGESACVTYGAFTFKDKVVTVPLTNTESQPMTLQALNLTWPSSNGKLTKVKVDGKVIYDKDIQPTSAVINVFKGTEPQRTLAPGETKILTLEFDKKVDKVASNYEVNAEFPCCSEPPPPPTGGGSLSGYVYYDFNSSNVRESGPLGDPGIVNVSIFLYDSHGVLVAQTTTDDNGFYSFTGLVADTYTISESQPIPYITASNNLGSLGGTTGLDSFIVTISAGANGTDYNFGERLPGG